MDAYEIVGYEFYESADNIRKILRTINKSGQIAHNPSAKKQYLCTGFPIKAYYNGWRQP